MLALYVATVFVGASLLFVVQPLFGRMILPRLGGSPSVWNTALVFYQAVLLLGYAYAHVATRRLGVKRQSLLHGLVLLLPIVFLPLLLPADRIPPTTENPIPWILALMATTVGVPFFVVSTTGPLLQRWFAETGHRTSHDPYFLYAASNLGSMLGLLGYPFLIEPMLTLRQQGFLWAWGYGLLAVLTALCALTLWRRPATAPATTETPSAAPPPAALPWKRKLRWVMLAFVPSSLMVGVTTHLTADIAAVPLLWVIPLAIYLMTFTLAFAGRPLISQAKLLRVLPYLILSLVIVLASRSVGSVPLLLAIHLIGLFVIAYLLHGELAADRPPASQLTEFYLWIAFGGVLGGAFNGLLAPVVFSSVLEYPIALVLACMLAPPLAEVKPGTRARVLDFALPLVLGVVMYGLVSLFQKAGLSAEKATFFVLFPLPALFAFSFSRRPLRFALGIAALLIGSSPFEPDGRKLLIEERNFFGVLRVLMTDKNQHVMYHGSTVHGMESLDPEMRKEPLSYYHRKGPLGQVFTALEDVGRVQTVGIIGLGAGALAGYAQPGQKWTVYEIDPAVVRVAQDPAYFTFMAKSPVRIDVQVGDGRLSLEADRDARFDILVLDAYSSDAIPVHLLTRESLKLYADRLSDHGVMLFNISNRHLNLIPVVGRLAKDAGLVCRIRTDVWLTKKAYEAGHFPSVGAILARKADDLGPIALDDEWKEPVIPASAPLWTDDYSSLVSVLELNQDRLKNTVKPGVKEARRDSGQNASSSPK
ncbi:MAG: fused MFS/spermidine synthase [Candidatus Eiseniibacteriota bacterium]